VNEALRLSPFENDKKLLSTCHAHAGALAIASVALFPPWKFVYKYEGLRIERFAGYHPIWMSNAPADATALSKILSIEIGYGELGLVSVEIDTTRLTIQIVAIMLVILLVSGVLSGFVKVQPDFWGKTFVCLINRFDYGIMRQSLTALPQAVKHRNHVSHDQRASLVRDSEARA
jgi:hypothetical protein